MEIRLDNNAKVIRKVNYTEILEKLDIMSKQLDYEIKRRYGNATKDELDFLAEHPIIELSKLGIDLDEQS